MVIKCIHESLTSLMPQGLAVSVECVYTGVSILVMYVVIAVLMIYIKQKVCAIFLRNLQNIPGIQDERNEVLKKFKNS